MSTNMSFRNQVQKFSFSFIIRESSEKVSFLKCSTGALTAGLNYYRANISLKKGKLAISEIDDDDDIDGNNGMFILGGKDPYVSQLSLNATAKEYPEMRVMVIPNAGHFLHQDEPEITNNLIRDFLGPASSWNAVCND